ncbi:MAG: two-component system response regulator [Rickettsiales bacterium]|nr:two-component system response regulator [Rickettsiales bacterium]|tara:strand:- start:78 stop:458 length:381 start_codon:yes stop_codon:yes gene_type:complete
MTKKILIVEDNDLNLKLFRDLLGANGFDTVETKEGMEAISLTREIKPDLILMDIQLPEISGLDVTKRIKADPAISGIPIVAVTAFAMKDDEEKILRAGCEAYISKPISIQHFMETVRKFLGEAVGA